MFYKWLATCFPTHHFKTFLISFLTDVLKRSYQKHFEIPIFIMLIKSSASYMSKQRWRRAIIADFRGFCQKLPHMQSLKVTIEQGQN